MLNEEISDAELNISNFSIFRSDRKVGHGGGSCIYVRNTLSAEYDNDFVVSDCMSIKLTIDSFDLILICIYRSPALLHESNIFMINKINQYISNVSNDKHIIMVGDFNLPNVDWDNGTVICPSNTTNRVYLTQLSFLDLFRLHNLTWCLDNSMTSRCRLVSQNLQTSTLDQILSTDSNIFKNIVLTSPLLKSDHAGVLCFLNLNTNCNFLSTNKLNWGKVKIEELCSYGNDICWKFNTSTVQTMWDELHTKLISITEKVPKLKIYTDASGTPINREPFCNSALRQSKKAVDKLWHKMNKDPSPLNYNLAREASHIYEEKLQQNMIKYEQKITSQLKSNPKAFYSYISSKRKVKNTISGLRDKNGNFLSSAEDIANELGSFFHSTFTNEPEGTIPKLENTVTGNIDDLTITEEQVRTVLSHVNISKSQGPDNIHPKLLKSLTANEEFITALTTLFQQCYNTGKIPEIWKIANITALHKKGDKLNSNNYRPISLTSVLSKCYERIVRDHILEYFEKYISSEQHGFVPKRSCLSNLLECLHKAYDILDDNESLDLIYLDFMKAFDSVPHKRLLSKLRSYGITGKTLSIIKDFLENRSFRVRIGDKYSKLYRVLSGVPQGTVLGPLLFIIYINDLPHGLSSFISLFADDLKLLSSTKNVLITQSDLDYLTNWQNMWLLKFNTNDKKCKVMHVGKNNPMTEYYLNGQPLPKITEEKDLGVLVSDKLTWDLHIRQSINKANSIMGWVSRNIISKEKNVMLNIYKSLIRPQLEYCVQIWNLTPRYGNWALILEIEKVQRDFTRRIQGLGLLSYRDRLTELDLTTLLERRARGDLIECFKIFRGLTNYGANLLNLSRSGYNLVRKANKGDKVADFFPERIINYWNKLPDELKEVETVTSYKVKLQQFKVMNLETLSGQFWELSEVIFTKMETSNRDSYVDYMVQNKSVANRRFISF